MSAGHHNKASEHLIHAAYMQRITTWKPRSLMRLETMKRQHYAHTARSHAIHARGHSDDAVKAQTRHCSVTMRQVPRPRLGAPFCQRLCNRPSLGGPSRRPGHIISIWSIRSRLPVRSVWRCHRRHRKASKLESISIHIEPAWNSWSAHGFR
jgi:hypothetical protein